MEEERKNRLIKTPPCYRLLGGGGEEFFVLGLVLFEFFEGVLGEGFVVGVVRRDALVVEGGVEAGVLGEELEHVLGVDGLGGVLLGGLGGLFVLAGARLLGGAGGFVAGAEIQRAVEDGFCRRGILVHDVEAEALELVRLQSGAADEGLVDEGVGVHDFGARVELGFPLLVVDFRGEKEVVVVAQLAGRRVGVRDPVQLALGLLGHVSFGHDGARDGHDVAGVVPLQYPVARDDHGVSQARGPARRQSEEIVVLGVFPEVVGVDEERVGQSQGVRPVTVWQLRG
mmetsp:Transcript_24733/g.76399  ORF Transcript_24733/g.76399 Transcript_24733/m.76399 type:complete len:284 (-) Transcript_24733:1283-2134(-)